ncbi:MAG: glycosyltransferase [Cyanobacteria bacterium J06639_14]
MVIQIKPSSYSQEQASSLSKRVLIILYAGDYRDAYQRIKSGRGEAYHGQKYALDTIAGLNHEIEEAAFLCCRSKERYDELIGSGLRVIGAAADPYKDVKELLNVIEGYRPTHIVLRMPHRPILQWAIKHRVKTITALADSFNLRGIRARIDYLRLARLLNNAMVDWVGNHGVNACLSLRNIGVKPHKLIPWDWPHVKKPHDFPARELSSISSPVVLLYVGTISRKKGVYDLIHSIKRLKATNILVRLRLIGRGEVESTLNLVNSLGLNDLVEYMGVIPNKEIIPCMQAADAVVVPSHHEYGEGFPLVIYEALCARTPLIVSNHPMFIRNLKHGHNALIFPEKQPKMLADCIKTLISDPNLYAEISRNTLITWQNLQIPVLWGDLIAHWIKGSMESQEWLVQHCVSSGLYN